MKIISDLNVLVIKIGDRRYFILKEEHDMACLLDCTYSFHRLYQANLMSTCLNAHIPSPNLLLL